MGKQDKQAIVVDDESYTGKVILSILRKFGYRASYFDNPLSALEFVKSCGPIDLLLSDYHMPDLNGVEFALKAKEVNPAIRVVVIACGMATSFIKDSAERNGFKFIEKPFRMAALRAII